MAQKAKKERAKSNAATLNNLHIGTLLINVLFMLFNLLYSHRSILIYFVFSLPCFIAEFILERTGRPKYDANTKALRSSGEDLAAQGLTEYMFDVIWVTWFCLVIVMLFGNWGWCVWGVVPAFGAYKGYGLLGMARGLMGGAQTGQMPDEQHVQTGGNKNSKRAA